MKKRIFLTKLFHVFLLVIFSTQLLATYQKIESYCISQGVYCSDYYMKKNDLFLYIGCDQSFYIVDISNPLEPFLIGSCEIPNRIASIDISESLACVTTKQDFFEGLFVIDISNPQNPEIVGSYYQLDFGNDVAISGSYVYVADGDSGLQVVDISDPYNPSIIANYDTPGYSETIVISGLNAFIADGNFGLQILDISEPNNPLCIGSYNNSNYVYSVAISNSIAYVGANDEELITIDVSNPENPVLLNSLELGQWVERISLSESNIFVFNQFGEMRIIDITDPEAPFVKGAYPTRSALGYSDNLVFSIYLSSPYFNLYLEILDISDPINPYLISNLETESYAGALDVSGTTAYVTNSESGLKIIDISDPANPTLLSTYNIPQYSFARSVAVIGTTVYLVTGQELLVIDVSDPYNPNLLINFDTPYGSTDICIYDSIAYLANSFLYIFDISNPQNPIQLCSFDTPGGVNNITISNSVAHISNWSIGYSIVDISNPQDPILLGHYDTYQDAYVHSIADYNTIAYLSVLHSLRIMDISDPQNIDLLNVVEPHQDSMIRTKPLILDNKLILSDNSWCEYLRYDLSNPEQPELENSYRWNLPTYDMQIYNNDYLVTANGHFGISILDLRTITSAANSLVDPFQDSINNYPNPFNPSTTIEFSIQQDSNIELSIFNIKGQKIKTLVNNEFMTGSHSIKWNGDNESGNSVSSGIYFYNLSINGKSEAVKKCLLLK
jgi:hypothetical protein